MWLFVERFFNYELAEILFIGMSDQSRLERTIQQKPTYQQSSVSV